MPTRYRPARSPRERRHAGRPPAGRGRTRHRAERSSPAALVVAGIAAGLAAGTKLSFLAPVAALTVGVVAIAPRTTRLRAAALWALPMLAAGGYWYARNLIAVGNPIPYIGSIGPISLPAPVRDFQLRPDFAVVHYWNDTGVWRHWFVPGPPRVVRDALAGDPGGHARRSAVFAIWRGARADPAGPGRLRARHRGRLRVHAR